MFVLSANEKERPIQTVYTILAALAIGAGACGSLMLFVMIMAGGANSTPEQIRVLKWLMLACAVGGLICFAGGVGLVIRSHPALAGAVGVLPMVVLVGLMIWAEVSR